MIKANSILEQFCIYFTLDKTSSSLCLSGSSFENYTIFFLVREFTQNSLFLWQTAPIITEIFLLAPFLFSNKLLLIMRTELSRSDFEISGLDFPSGPKQQRLRLLQYIKLILTRKDIISKKHTHFTDENNLNLVFHLYHLKTLDF